MEYVKHMKTCTLVVVLTFIRLLDIYNKVTQLILYCVYYRYY